MIGYSHTSHSLVSIFSPQDGKTLPPSVALRPLRHRLMTFKVESYALQHCIKSVICLYQSRYQSVQLDDAGQGLSSSTMSFEEIASSM